MLVLLAGRIIITAGSLPLAYAEELSGTAEEFIVIMALQASDKGDYTTALGLLRRGVEMESSRATYFLGQHYRAGKGLQVDYSEAFKLYETAAAKGVPAAYYELGQMYAEGQGVPVNNREAARLYLKAAEQGDSVAQGMLGVLYEVGTMGLLQDYKKACMWTLQAAENGIVISQVSLAEAYATGKGCTPVSYPEAARWFKRAADQGNGRAQWKLAAMYFVGRGVPQNYLMTHMWSNLAAANGEKQGEELRNMVSGYLSPAQIAQAQQMAQNWKPTEEEGWKDARLGWKRDKN